LENQVFAEGLIDLDLEGIILFVSAVFPPVNGAELRIEETGKSGARVGLRLIDIPGIKQVNVPKIPLLSIISLCIPDAEVRNAS